MIRHAYFYLIIEGVDRLSEWRKVGFAFISFIPIFFSYENT